VIQTESKNPNIKVMKLDLASLQSVRNFTQEFTNYNKQVKKDCKRRGYFE